MSFQRLCGLLLLAVQVAVLWYFTRTVMFPIWVLAVAVSSFFVPLRFTIDRRRSFWGLVGLFLAFVLMYYISPHTFDFTMQFIRTPFAYSVGQYFLAVQTIQFYIRRPDDRLPLTIPGLGIVTLVCFGDLQPAPVQLQFFQAAVITFVALAALFVAASGRTVPQAVRRISPLPVVVSLIVLAMALGIGWGASEGLRRYERDVDELVARFLIPDDLNTTAGFSGAAKLGSVAKVKSENSKQIALRVYAEREPGYLRGAAFETYGNRTWESNTARTDVPAMTDRPPGIAAAPREYQTFLADSRPVEGWTQLEVWPSAAQPPALFAPLGTTLLQVPVARLQHDANDVFYSTSLLQGIPYYVATPSAADGDSPRSAARELSPRDIARLTRVPDQLDPRIAELAQRFGEELRSTPEKIAAVEAYFTENYQYQIGITIPPGVDPLNHFLIERPPAHCEYFASGATVLLRLMGVPCRYVTGFVCVEKNDVGGYWVARNQHAHAWVEAYDPQYGWIIVEATPESGVPESEPTAHAKQLWEYIREAFLSLRIQLQQGFVRMALRSLAQSWGLMFFIAAIVGYIAWRRFGGRISWTSRRKVRLDPQLVELRRLLDRMDARMRQWNLQRGPGETLHQFASRIANSAREEASSSAATWYQRYAHLRYSGPIDKSSLDDLAQALKKI